MKRVISAILAIIMCFSISISAFALPQSRFDTQINRLSRYYDVAAKDLQQQAESDKESFKRLYISSEMLNPSRLTPDGRVVYSVWFGDTLNEITVKELYNGDILFDFYEGSLHNELIICDDNSLYVDGELAHQQNEHYSDDIIELEQDVFEFEHSNEVQRRARYEEWSTNPFYPVSTYTVFEGTYTKNTVSWGVSTLAGLAIGVVVALVTAKISIAIALTVGEQAAIGGITSFAAAMISHCNVYGMEDAYFSFSFKKYSTTAAIPTENSYKFVGACYSERNLGGTAYNHTMYYLNYFS